MRALLFASILLSGLVAGLLYAYSCSVNNGLKALADDEYIKAMQSINIAIQNPVMGLLLVFPITAYQLYTQQPAAFLLFAAAMVIYFVGVFGLTVFGNVPLNEELAKFPIQTATQTEVSVMREVFEKRWNAYHTVRTIASIASFSLTILSLLKQKM